MNEDEKRDFINSYTKALVTSWSSEDYAARLQNDPRSALAEAGLNVPEHARLEIVRTVPEETDPNATSGHLDRQVALWQVGLDTGLYQVYMPETPQVELDENVDLEQLESVAGGDVNCCCCPCSCCT